MQTPQKLHIDLSTGESSYIDLSPEELEQHAIDRAAALKREQELEALEKQQAAHEDAKTALMQMLSADLETLEGDGALTAQQQREILARVVRALVSL